MKNVNHDIKYEIYMNLDIDDLAAKGASLDSFYLYYR